MAFVTSFIPKTLSTKPASVSLQPPAKAIIAKKRARVMNMKLDSGDENTIDYENNPDTVFYDDACDLFGKNCNPDGSVPLGANRRMNDGTSKNEGESGQRVTDLGFEPGMVNYEGSVSVLRDDSVQ